MIITIDGPVASGKSTAAQLLAQALGYYYINSGMIFRALAFSLINHLDVSDLNDLSSSVIDEALSRLDYHYESETNELRIFVDGNDIIGILKSPEVDQIASRIGKNEDVRKAVTDLQRQLGAMHKNVVVEGRDAGTIVFPHADVKFYITAKPEVRAKRWIADQKAKDEVFTLEEALAQITERDTRDMTRKIAPLVKAYDAIEIDTSDSDKQETLEILLGVVTG